MKVLLGTHALLWWLSDSDRLGESAREIIADPVHDILVSIVSLWEIAIKIRIGKLDADMNDILAAIPGEWFLSAGNKARAPTDPDVFASASS